MANEALQKGNRHFAGYLNECQPGYEWAATSLYMWHGMPYRAFGKTNEKVSLLGVGGYHLGIPSEDEAISIVHESIV